MEALSFKGKVVLVIGAGSQIGAEVARLFSKLGASLVLSDRDKCNLNRLDFECGGDCLLIAADLSKDEDLLSIFKQTVHRFKKLDIVVNYVGVAEGGSDNSSEKHDHQIMNVNVQVLYHVAVLAAPYLVKTRGNIVNVAGFSSEMTPHDLSYCVSRAALDQLNKCLALQLVSDGLRVNAVSTDIGAICGQSADSAKKSTGHPGTPGDVAAAVIFLASDLSSSVVGANLDFDGGRHLMSTSLMDHNSNIGDAKNKSTKADVISADPNKQEVVKDQKAEPKDQAKRDNRKEETTKQSSSKDNQKVDADKFTPKQNNDKNHHGSPVKHGSH